MSRYGKNLWPEDARQPFPLEPVHWSRVGRHGDAVSLRRLDDAVETNLAFCQTTRSHHSSEEVEPRNGFKQSVACFFSTIPEQSPVGNTCWLVPAGAVGMPWTHTERNSATDHPCRPVELPALWNCKMVIRSMLVASALSLGSIAPMTTPRQQLTVCDASASGLTKRINLQPSVSIRRLGRTPAYCQVPNGSDRSLSFILKRMA